MRSGRNGGMVDKQAGISRTSQGPALEGSQILVATAAAEG